MNARGPWVLCLLGGAALLLWCGALLGGALSRRAQRRSGRLFNERGQRGELEAEKLLRSLGYRVLGRHVAGRYALEVDGTPEDVQLIADLLVERDGRELVVEVKTGRQAPRLGHADTRRQMLEYQLAFGVPGVLLVDAEAKLVREVRFPLAPARRETHGVTWLWLTAFTLAALAALAWRGD
jgi:Holliday junction resolvase-like predicted endonuclease